MLAEYFYLDAQGEAQGPYSPEQLVALETLGYIHTETLVATTGSADWRAFSQLTAELGPELYALMLTRLRLPLPTDTPRPDPEPVLTDEKGSLAEGNVRKSARGKARGGASGKTRDGETNPGKSTANKSEAESDAEADREGEAALAALALERSRTRWLMPLLVGAQTALILVLVAVLVPLSTQVAKVGGRVDRLSETLPEDTARASATATRQVFGEFEGSLLSRLIPRDGTVPSPTPGGVKPADSEVPAFLLKRTSAREVKLDEYLARMDVQTETMLRGQGAAAWTELELLTSSNAFRGLTQKARESFLAERVAVFREWPDLRFETSPLSKELVRLLRTLGEQDSQRLFAPGGLRAVVFDLGRSVRSMRVLRQFEEDPLKMPDWEAVNTTSRDRAWSLYPAARDLGSPLMARIDEIHRRLEREKHPLMANPFYPWIVTELAADSMGMRPVNPFPAPPSAETKAAARALQSMGDPEAIAKEMTAFSLHDETAVLAGAPDLVDGPGSRMTEGALELPSPTPLILAPVAEASENAPGLPRVALPGVPAGGADLRPMVDFAPAAPDISGDVEGTPGSGDSSMMVQP